MRSFVVFLCLFALPVHAVEIRLAEREEAARIAADTSTGYFERMSQADPTIRLQADSRKSPADLREAYRTRGGRDFTAEERRALERLLRGEAERIALLERWLPDEVVLAAVTDTVEGGLPHTRANAILFPPGSLDDADERAGLFYHELFHVLSRHNPDRHPELYGLINFSRCPSIDIPAPFDARRITNPDAPVNNYWVQAAYRGEPVQVIPLLYAVSAGYVPRRGGGGFSSQFRFGYLQIEADGETCRPVRGRDGAPIVVPPDKIEELFDAVGANTNYLIHPEEILASNFALLMTGTSVRDRWVLDRLAGFLGLPEEVGEPVLSR